MYVFMKRILFLFFCFFTINGQIEAQNNPLAETNITPPTAAALVKYADYPVSYHTGIPNINIPIYTVQNGPLEVPISLSYHASGLKVQELASWVGAGWSLNAGGVITRSVVGLPDDRGFSNTNVTNGHWSDFGYNSYLGTTNGNVDDAGFYQGRKDGEPDLYFFNFGKYTGKFYFRDDRTPITVPEQDLKIEPDYKYLTTPYQNGTCFQGFKITTPDGTQYFFGNTGNTGSVMPLEITSPYSMKNGLSSGSAVSSWYLNKIVSKDNMFTINFTYQQENYSYYTLSMFPIYSTNTIGQYEYDVVKQFVQGVRLSSITYNGNTISFNPAATPRIDLSAYTPQTMADNANTTANALDNITISNGLGFCKKFQFTYGYFHDGVNGLNGILGTYLSNIQSDTYRLRLDALQESSCDGSITEPPYQFGYYGEMVPRLLAFGIDHWGYYNGITSNNTLIPTYTVNNTKTVNGANRDAQWPAMRGGALQQITYPTGGYTKFNFEPHYVTRSVPGYQTINVTNSSVLYDGSTYQTLSFTTPSGYSNYMLSLSSTTTGVSGTYQVFDPNGNMVINATIQSGTSTTQAITLTPGTTYTSRLYGTTTTTAWGGCSASISYQMPVTNITNITIGGLRINSMVHHDPLASQDIVTTYDYNAGGSSSTGILYSMPTYVNVLRNDMYGLIWGNTSNGVYNPYGCATLTGGGFEAAYLISPSSVLPMRTTMGNHIGYSEVDVSQSGNGKSVYRYYSAHYWDAFQNSNDVVVRNVNDLSCDGSVSSYPYAPLPFDSITGELKYEAYFNQSNQILKDIWHYPTYSQDSVGTPGYICKNVPISSTSNLLWGTEYELHSFFKTQDKTVETDYEPINGKQISTTSIINYQSPFHHQPSQKIIYSSLGDNLITNYNYAFDFRLSNCDGIDNGYQNYLTNYNTATSTFYNSIYSCTPTTNDANNCRWLSYENYRINKAQARSNYVNYHYSNFTSPTSTFNNNHIQDKNNADTELKPILELQDEFDNALIETSNWKNSSLVGADFTRYDYVTNPAGFVAPQKTQKINIISPSASFTNAVTYNNTSITKDNRYEDENNYIFYGGNLVSVTKKDGIKNSYIWGYNNQYPVAKITGADFYSANNLLNQSIIQNPATDAQLRTELSKLNPQNLPNSQANIYTYSPLLGMTSFTSSNGILNYYEYEGLGRLKDIRDNSNNVIKLFDYQYQKPAYSSTVQMTSISVTNVVTGVFYFIQLTNVATGQIYNFKIIGTGVYGQIPYGNYNITLHASDYSANHMWMINNTYSESGVATATFNNISLSTATTTVAIY
ncbi:hypothetical protein [Hydrotalea sandarakina]|jgi:hypothetical protein|uniref:YD repeat-containing protein n=1 Tax=Hydrotalea sandarakina TaxID=1004304 RepID=A0A2W7RSV5_9BACT|nr:hypothetical protein [Hydrotalea sandarakina]PZX63404.1 hypothetical protein LX80_01046 [Hydrotalea sandarakina]